MKSAFIALLLSSLALSVHAEMQFPDYNKLHPEWQKAWGYVVRVNEGNNPTLQLTIPPKAATAYRAARLFIRDKKHSLLAEIDMALVRLPDGSLTTTIQLFEGLRGDAELVIYTESLPDAVAMMNFGGFTFNLTTPK